MRTTLEVGKGLLALVGYELSNYAWRKWTLEQREAACDWAMFVYLRSRDKGYVTKRMVPEHVKGLPITS